MLVFSASDKGGTGRSVTSCNMAYQLSMDGLKVAYLDFDFGSPTVGAIFEISRIDRGIPGDTGMHSYLLGNNGSAARLSVRSETDRPELRHSRHPSGRLVLFPGDAGGAEFASVDAAMVRRCTELLATCEQEFDVTLVDLSAGRSIALTLVLYATAMPQLDRSTVRWLVFHRWTRQHLVAAYGLVHGPHGLLKTGVACGHSEERLIDSVRYVRTAVPELNEAIGLRPAQAAWLQEQNATLSRAAIRYELGTTRMLGATPVEPMLQWREQVILDVDVADRIANEKTVSAFRDLAARLSNQAVWERLEGQ
ncbi:SCO2523 family variant P-loop protein [Nocardia sp. NBC_01503]|uniref:SCO2523 family variant P-loop protein n=1 Tax=Nocardia sp. NBC_01503 TaxID=2975997 RepID=UPI002E7B3C95|nr:SCO2523 family variant P-loop protein [Nocardia sp. NBC_01503]WTL34804.1 SCO2523 family variant P-loop protein [Nocardia sp. NBC_01503]